MLVKEQDVKEERHIAQRELGWISEYSRPVTTTGGVYHQLQEGQDCSRNIQQEHGDTEAFGRLATKVEPRLRSVFYYREQCLDITQKVDLGNSQMENSKKTSVGRS